VGFTYSHPHQVNVNLFSSVSHSLLRELDAATNEFLNRRVTISAEEFVRLGFGGLQERLDVSERVMNFICEGFEKMNKDWFRLREELSK
jgi:hypothetical protein